MIKQFLILLLAGFAIVLVRYHTNLSQELMGVSLFLSDSRDSPENYLDQAVKGYLRRLFYVTTNFVT